MASKHTVMRCCAALLLVLAAAPSAWAHSDKSSKGGDGFYKPVSQNAAWKRYRFQVGTKNEETSFRTAPPPNEAGDQNEPGSIATLTSQLFNDKQEQLGIGVWDRIVASNKPLPGTGDRFTQRLLNAQFEFGNMANYFTDASLSFQLLTTRLLNDKPGYFVHWDGIVTGGKGRFYGATGTMTVSQPEFNDSDFVLSAVYTFDIHVPNNLPK